MTRFEPKPYEHYKDTETKWLGSIPAYWRVKRVKDEFISLDSKRVPLSGEERQIMANPVYDYYGASGVIDKVDDYIFDEPLLLIGEDGANLLLRGSQLAFIAKGKYWVNNHAHVLRPKKGNLEYLCYLLESFDYTELISGSAQPKLTAGALNNVLLMLPPLEEQQAIADYLDAKTAQIDRKIELLEHKAEKYADLKKSLINETVTRGLDKSVPMKDSGVEWIGKIPSHWEVRRVQDISRVIDPQPDHRAPALAESNGYPYIGIRDLNRDGSLNFETARSVDLSAVEKQEMAFRVSPGDIVFCKVGTLGEPRIIIPKDRFALSATLVLIKVKKASNIFLRYALDSSCALKQIEHFGSGSTRPALGIKQIRKFFIPLPPLGEQREIANYLEAKIFQIDKIIERVTTQIEKLKELRKTLINDVVTGKIKVYEGDVSADGKSAG